MIKKQLPKYKLNELKAKQLYKKQKENEQSTTTQHRSITIN